jgi:DNA-binding SARP family transcriptional activator
MRFKVLGPFEVRRDDADLTPTAPRLREILALLVVRHNRVVTTRELVDELWGDTPPATAVPTLQTYVYRLRRLFAGRKPTRDEGVLRTKGDGYLLDIPQEDVDLHHFTSLTREGRAALGSGDAGRASRLCAQALDLWAGDTALGGVISGDLLTAHITRLEEMRLRVLEIRIEADLQLGEHSELVSELKGLTMTYPLHEAFYGQLMLALHRANRRSEALSTYRRLRELLINELGLEPSARLRELQQALLAADPALDLAPAQPARPNHGLTPAQLPPDIGDFVGRKAQLKVADRLLLGDNSRTLATPVLAITGMPGVGKTALAVHIGHRARTAYPDGQLYAELGGSTNRPSDPTAVLGQFLRALGLPEGQLPAGAQERTTLFRTWTADRRVLVVLDDAAAVQQVQPLLPGGERCGVVVTSRRRFSGVSGAHEVEVPPLAGDEAGELLGALLGQQAVADDRLAAGRVAMACGHLPLAIRGVAAQLVACGSESLASAWQRLRPEQGRFEELRFGQFDLGDRLRTALRMLSGEVNAAIGTLAGFAVPTFTLGQAVAALGCDESTCRRILVRLVECNLLRVLGPDMPATTRYGFHPLVRLYARQQLAEAPDRRDQTITLFPMLPGVEAAAEHNGSHVDLPGRS